MNYRRITGCSYDTGSSIGIILILCSYELALRNSNTFIGRNINRGFVLHSVLQAGHGQVFNRDIPGIDLENGFVVAVARIALGSIKSFYQLMPITINCDFAVNHDIVFRACWNRNITTKRDFR